ncbi:MAG: sensor domain-containing diguanylate cyclase [Lachnospiraceae bacterium]|nr:sensor domain-containing diguanylate cyclase [Lachnospiraceae bacterium]
MNDNYRKIQFRIIVLFSLVLLLLTFFLTIVPYKRSVISIQNNFSKLMTAGGGQLRANVDTFFLGTEKTAALMFSDADIYEYDPVTSSLDEYDRLQIKEKILNRIDELGNMGNYVDFGIIYSNDETAGWISESMSTQYMNGGLYKEFEKTISYGGSLDGWSFAHKGNYDKLYYAKRLNEDAIIVMSFYGHELESIFEFPEKISKDMMAVLVDSDNRILYSNNTEIVGTILDPEISNMSSYDSDRTIVGSKYMVMTTECMNGWRIICSEPVSSMLEDSLRYQKFIMFFALGCCVLFIIAAQFMFIKLSKPVKGLVSELNIQASVDQLSGVLNKNTFREQVVLRLTQMKHGTIHSFLMLDMDNFKQINDNLGHEYGDEVISRLGRILNEMTGFDVFVGRIGGDEFAVFLTLPGNHMFSADRTAHDFVDQLLMSFDRNFEEERRKYGLSMSIGVVTSTEHLTYDDFYRMADDMMYQSKRTGKDKTTYCVYPAEGGVRS